MKIYSNGKLLVQRSHHACTHAPPGDADLTERFINEAASLVPLYAAAFVVYFAWYLIFVFGGCPSASPELVFSSMFLNAQMKISFMSIFARFMYV